MLLEQNYTTSIAPRARTYSIRNLPTKWAKKTIEYLSSLENVEVNKHEKMSNPIHTSYVLTRDKFDKLTINLYQTGTMTLQGKPAYLYSEAISFLSYCKDITVDDIVDSVNSFHNINVKTSDVRNTLETLMPRAYGNIDEMIIKLLSPSIALRNVFIELEDYSCYTFPALRALEGYIKYLLGKKNITVKKSFGEIFNKTTLLPSIAMIINDLTYQSELEKLYTYFKGKRHIIFHAEQILIGTTVIEDKHEADEIINSVIHLIESSYININKQ